jgi:hypothetical protein
MARMKTVAAAGRRCDEERGRRMATLRCGGDVGRWAAGHRGDCRGGVTEHGRGAAAIFFLRNCVIGELSGELSG